MDKLLRAIALACTLACSGKNSPDNTAACGAGFERIGDKCERCPTWTIAGEGPGCGCAEGFAYDANKRACGPILPATDCGPGTMAVLGQRECQAVGVDALAGCATGFKSDGRGGCDAILPTMACAAGTMAVPGESACHEVAPCGALPEEPGAVYVDKAFVGTSDGSRARPFVTIGAALAVAKADSLIAINDGVYAEDVRITRPVRVRGRCPGKVTIQGVGTTDADSAVFITVTGKALLEGVSVTGPAMGVQVEHGEVELARIHVHDVPLRGVRARGKLATTTLRGSLVEKASETGVFAHGSKVIVEGSVIRDTRSRPDRTWGRGIHVQADPTSKFSSELTVRGSIVERNFEDGIALLGSKGTIESTIVRDTKCTELDKKAGTGIYALNVINIPSELTLRGSILEKNHYTGVAIWSSKATIETTVVRDTLPRDFDRKFGRAIDASLDAADSGTPTELVMRGCVIERNRELGIGVFGSTATIESTIVRDTTPQLADRFGGRGINAIPIGTTPSTLTLQRCLVENNVEIAVSIIGSNGTIEKTLVRDSRPRETDNLFGRAIGVQMHDVTKLTSDAVIRGVLLERNHESGITVFGSHAVIESSLIRDTKPTVGTEYGDGISVLGRTSWVAHADVELSGVMIVSSARAGLVTYGGSNVAVANTRFGCNAIDLVSVNGVADGAETTPIFNAAAGNQCGCDAEVVCKAESKDMTSIPPPALK
jgi:hypothetical protein